MKPTSEMADKVRKLLSLSHSANVHEAANAANAANRYIIKYRLKEADLIEKKQNDPSNIEEYYPEPIYDDPDPIYTSARVTAWKLHLLSLLASYYGCAVWNDKSYGTSIAGRNVSQFRIVGRLDDVKYTRYMFSWLVEQIKTHSDRDCKGRGYAAAASYCQGAVQGVHDLLKSTREQYWALARAEGSAQALARIDNREAEAKAYMYRKYNLVDAAPEKPKFDPVSFEKGFNVGENLGRSV